LFPRREVATFGEPSSETTMIRTIARLLSLFVLPLVAAAQSGTNAERFDLTGIHGRGTVEAALRQRATAHLAGDIADAVALQRDLAAYYRTHADTARARQAAEKAGTAQPSGAAAPTQGPEKAPAFGSVKAPKYGSVKAPSYGSVSAPSSDSTKAPSSGSAHTPKSGTPGGVVTIPLAKPAPAPGPGAMKASFYHMNGPSSETTWDFLADGTYLKTSIGGGTGVSARSSERGTYTISNGTLEVHVTRKTGASTTTVTGGDRSILTGSTQQASEVHRYAIELLGTNGGGGMVLDGVTYKVKTW
jgi:hypothetical protein